MAGDKAKLDHDAVRRFYDDEYYGTAHRQGGLPWHMSRVASRLGNLSGKPVLDIACGDGSWLRELAGRGAIPSGLDISARAVAQARRLLPGADIREGVAESLPFADSSFDLVTCMGSLEHFIDQPGALREMHRVGTAAGRLLVLVPNAGFLTRQVGLYGGTGQVTIRETVRALSEWQRMLNDAGYRVDARWRDLHPLSSAWIRQGSPITWPLRTAQALALATWPIEWQYQVYFWCSRQ